MKIGIDARRLRQKNLTGIGMYLFSIISYIDENDFENEYYLYTNKPLEYKFKNKNIHEVVINTNSVFNKLGSLWIEYVLPRFIVKDKIEVFWGPENALPKKCKNVKMVVTIHDLALWIDSSWGKFSNYIIQRFVVPKSIRRADKIIAISEATKLDILKFFKVKEERINVIYNGLSVNHHKSEKESIELTKEKFNIKKKYILYVGTIEPRKNINTIIKSFNHITEDIQLVLCGGLGWRYQSIIDCIDNCSNKENIIQTGFVSEQEKIDLLSGAELFLFPSNYEGFGFPILEAMELEVPVITDRVSSLPEVAGDAAIYLKNHQDDIELGKLISSSLSMSVNEKNELIKKGKDRVKKFDIRNCASDTMHLLYQL